MTTNSNATAKTNTAICACKDCTCGNACTCANCGCKRA